MHSLLGSVKNEFWTKKLGHEFGEVVVPVLLAAELLITTTTVLVPGSSRVVFLKLLVKRASFLLALLFLVQVLVRDTHISYAVDTLLAISTTVATGTWCSTCTYYYLVLVVRSDRVYSEYNTTTHSTKIINLEMTLFCFISG
jgi:hypothetical protein